MPCQGRNGFLVATKNANVPHHTEVEDSRGLVARRGSEKIAVYARKSSSRHSVLMAVKRSQAPRGPRIPEFDLVILGSRNQQPLCRMPIARLNIPIVTR